VVNALAALSPGERPGTHYTGGWVGPTAGQYYVNEKIPMRTSGIEPAIFRLVAQCLKQV